ncbi:MAG TPA: copper resistance CopC family protein, partial [Candidatus Dormibacteraeota bacterium]|nr:copper resistance CopC family protein [Candidatus Dormibacteraeota bacterium]
MIPRRSLLAAASIAALLAAVPAVAAAHAELQSSTPAAGEILDTAPTEVTLTFDDELDPDSSSFTVVDADGHDVGTGDVDLTIADRNVMSGEVTIGDPGVYTVEYVVVGEDGHPVTSTFSFGYATDEPIPDPTSVAGPNTALRQPAAPVATVIGVMLVL